MSEVVDVLSLLEQFEAQLENTKPANSGGGQDLPAGLYQAVVKGVSVPKPYKRDDGTAPLYFQFLLEILADSHENQFVGRSHKLFQSFDVGPNARKRDNGDFADLAEYRQRISDFGLPEATSTKPKLLQEILGPGSHISEFRDSYGPLPCIEFKLVAGERPNKKGKIPIFFNFIRQLNPEEAGEMDAIPDGGTVADGEIPF